VGQHGEKAVRTIIAVWGHMKKKRKAGMEVNISTRRASIVIIVTTKRRKVEAITRSTNLLKYVILKQDDC